MRPAFGTAYLLCRYADTIADTPILPSSRRLYWIERFPHLLQEQTPSDTAQLTQEISAPSENPYETELIKHLPACLEALNTLDDTLRGIIMDVVYAVCEGMKTDLTFFPAEHSRELRAFDTPAELERYCRLMGGEPGLFWSRLIYHTAPIAMPEEAFYALGQQIGDALQIVNILRDLPKDLRIGRCYFPRMDLETAGLSAADLLAPENSARFEPVKRALESIPRTLPAGPPTPGKNFTRRHLPHDALHPSAAPKQRTICLLAGQKAAPLSLISVSPPV